MFSFANLVVLLFQFYIIMDIRAWSIRCAIGVDCKPDDAVMENAVRYVAAIAHAFSSSAKVSVMDKTERKRMYLPQITGYWEREGEEAPSRDPELERVIGHLKECYALHSSIAVPVPGICSMLICVDANEAKVERCVHCKTTYRCTVNARRCEASHPKKGGGGKKRQAKSTCKLPLNGTLLAHYWDSLSREQRLALVQDCVFNEEKFADTNGTSIVELLDKACERTHLLCLLTKPPFISGMMTTEYDAMAEKMHSLAERLIKAYTAYHEQQLLALLETEKSTQDAKNYDKYLKQLERKIFHKTSPLFISPVHWWEDDC